MGNLKIINSFNRKLTRIVSICINGLVSPFVLFLILLMRLLKPIILIRLCRLHSLKFGHFAINTELFLCEKASGINTPNRRYIDIFFYGHKNVSSLSLAILWKRKIRIWNRFFFELLFFGNRLIPGGADFEVDLTLHTGLDRHSVFDRFQPQLSFSASEETIGQETLKKMGLTSLDKFVCVNFRDEAYHQKRLGPGMENIDGYRNSDISNFAKAAVYLASKGYFVFRMGKLTKRPFALNCPRVIDYSNSKFRSDFMDIYLGANCVFAVSTGTGWDAIPQIFRRPIAYVNVVTYNVMRTWGAFNLFLPKHYYSTVANRYLSLREIVSQNLHFSRSNDEFLKNNIVLIENTPDELLDVVTEMHQRQESKLSLFDATDFTLQARFLRLAAEAGTINGIVDDQASSRTAIGSRFLRKNLWMLE